MVASMCVVDHQEKLSAPLFRPCRLNGVLPMQIHYIILHTLHYITLHALQHASASHSLSYILEASRKAHAQ